jgi:hypothetical protein
MWMGSRINSIGFPQWISITWFYTVCRDGRVYKSVSEDLAEIRRQGRFVNIRQKVKDTTQKAEGVIPSQPLSHREP